MQLPIARYRLCARVQAPLKLPPYAGSLLRGQFGASLRQLACMTRAPRCPGCPLIPTCPYTRIFEAPPPPKGSHALQDFSKIPNPYIIEPPKLGERTLQPGDTLEFGLVLIGTALEQLALILFALERALRHGLTTSRSPCTLQRVDWVQADGACVEVWSEHAPKLVDHQPVLAWSVQPDDSRAARDAVDMHLHTPLRLQHQGHALPPGKLDARTLVATLTRRITLLLEFHAGVTDLGDHARAAVAAAAQLHDDKELRWMDWTRYSSRQQQEMTLGGVLGRWRLAGEPDALATVEPWLWLGQWLHVGKNATMGMGGYSITP